ncbi:hypothetical protein D4764_03G0012150 [Takifugu flavidus]|uniref:Uncharacterized protein n=1 Tax=Takifugu flavidus TaxID=433684 RepID=A0A5C6NFB7_9TELE|nr:hypothetical protein D4764_03G0012150 [Takifugu flavidus]
MVFPHGGLTGWEMFPAYRWGCCPVVNSGLGVRGLCALVWSLRSVRVRVVFVAVPPVVTDRDLPRPGGPPKVASPSPQVSVPSHVSACLSLFVCVGVCV